MQTLPAAQLRLTSSPHISSLTPLQLLAGSYGRSMAHVGGFETGGFPGLPQAIAEVVGPSAEVS